MTNPPDANTSDQAPLPAKQQKMLQTVAEHVEEYRAKARSHPESLLKNASLAEGLLDFCRRLIELGCPEDVPRVTRELVAVEGALARRYPEEYCWRFPRNLANLSGMLREKARPEEALRVMRDAVELGRGLAWLNPKAHSLDFTRGLIALGDMLRASGGPEEALKELEEVVEFYQALPEPRLWDFVLGFAESLVWRGRMFRELDRPREALQALLAADELMGSGSELEVELVENLEPLGKALNKKGYPAEARKAAEAVLRLRERQRERARERQRALDEEALDRAGVPHWLR